MENQPDEIAPIKAGRERYQQTGDAGALGESLRLGRQAVARLAGSGESAAIAALELAASLGLLYETDGQVEHLDEALSLLEGAVRVLPAGHEDLVPVYTNIAALRLARFTRVGDVGDLQSAVATGRLGAGCSRQDDPALATRYANLTGALRTLYQVTGDPAAIDESITMGRYGAKKLQPSTQAACLVLATLAASLQARAAGTGSAADLEEGINVARQAVAAAPDGSPWRPSAVDILAAACDCDSSWRAMSAISARPSHCTAKWRIRYPASVRSIRSTCSRSRRLSWSDSSGCGCGRILTPPRLRPIRH